jgi:hypothetical protein
MTEKCPPAANHPLVIGVVLYEIERNAIFNGIDFQNYTTFPRPQLIAYPNALGLNFRPVEFFPFHS